MAIFDIKDGVLKSCNISWSEKDIVIPDGVTKISSRAFSDYTSKNIKSITLPDSLEEIAYCAFEYCYDLEKINIPKSVKYIGYDAFLETKWLLKYPNDFVIEGDGILVRYNGNQQDVTIPDGVKQIGGGAFKNLQITNVTIPNSVAKICKSAFWNCSLLTNISIPDSVTEIEGRAFYDCSSLKIITIPENVTTLGELAFYRCENMESVTINGKIQTICEETFQGCHNLASVTLCDDITAIEERAFANCTSLKSIELPTKVTKIGNQAFYNCSSLASIKIPKTLTEIGEDPFAKTSWIKFYPDDFVIIGEGILIKYKGGRKKNINVPEGVVRIYKEVFNGHKTLVNLTLPDSLKIIDDSAFYQCESLENINLPEGLTTIGDSIFGCCRSLKSLSIPDGLTQIGKNILYGCRSLKALKIGNYTIDYTKFDSIKAELSGIKAILCDNDYSVKLDTATKYVIMSILVIEGQNPDAEAFVKKNIAKIIKHFIDMNDYPTIKALFECDKFITKRNIMTFVNYSIDNTQKGGDVSIQVFITNYKTNKFPDIDPFAKLKV